MKVIREFALIAALAIPVAAAEKTSCLTCHVDGPAEKYHADVHSQVGLSCHDCHGGNPDPNADYATAKDPRFKGNPFIGAPKRTDIPAFCGRCHSSAEYMKRFNPAARVDQVTEYRSSVHGQRLARGDENVATCIDCHSVHDMRRKTSPESPVYATHVAQTCSRCHSDPKLMAAYRVPTDQYARWRISMHANAIFEKNDLTAPTCNDCHGNHGATPPGVESVSFVCGNCHGREAELFRRSSKHEGWTRHNEFLAAGSKCGDCHDDARAQIQIANFSECVTCHENHGVVSPSVAMIADLPEIPCAFCHVGTGALATFVAEPSKKASHYREVRDQLLTDAARKHLTGQRRFDWLVDMTWQLPSHHMPAARSGERTPPRPEFARLFEKFRIGKTHYTFTDAAGKQVNVAVRSCSECHVANDEAGTTNARHFSSATQGLTSMIARAERIQLTAHRGGIETQQARVHLDSAIDNQIELESLVHTFGGPEVQKKAQEGLEHARIALMSAQQSVEELSYRRRGLFIALGIIILALVGLAMKIRTL